MFLTVIVDHNVIKTRFFLIIISNIIKNSNVTIFRISVEVFINSDLNYVLIDILSTHTAALRLGSVVLLSEPGRLRR